MFECDHIMQVIKLTSDYIKRLSMLPDCISQLSQEEAIVTLGRFRRFGDRIRNPILIANGLVKPWRSLNDVINETLTIRTCDFNFFCALADHLILITNALTIGPDFNDGPAVGSRVDHL